MRTATARAVPRDNASLSGTYQLNGADIDVLLNKLVRGHLSTLQEEYADLKHALADEYARGLRIKHT